MQPDTGISPNPRAVFRQLADGSGVLLHLGSAAYHGVNAVGALIWSKMGSGTTLRSLLDALRQEIDDPPVGLEDDVAGFLADLERRDLIQLHASDEASRSGEARAAT